MTPEIMQPTVIDDVLPVVDNAEEIDEDVTIQLTSNVEEGEKDE